MYWYLSFVDQLRGKGVSSSFTYRSRRMSNWREIGSKSELSKRKNDIDHGIEQLEPLVHSESWVLAGRLVLHLKFCNKVNFQLHFR